MQIIFFSFVVFFAIIINFLTNQGFFNVSDRLFWKQTSNLFSKNQPIKLSIPSVRIESSIEKVGVDSNGNMQTPTTPKIISWYQFGALPGEKGNLVFSGHRDSTIGPGVFFTLSNIKKGDPITVTTANNKTFTYIASNIVEVPRDDLPINDIFSSQKKLKQIYITTCAGNFDIFTKRYDDRVYVKGSLKN
ncbi:MAG: class F sortase [bacterium]|nr:class F sortase [bacterium]